jgi:hypothetical protein
MSAQRRCHGCGRLATRRAKYCDTGCARDHARRRAVALADEARADLDLTTSGYELTAEHPGTCPLCSRYIAAGRSRIVALATPTFPCVPVFDDDGNPGPRRRRRWVHADCLDRFAHDRQEEPTR